MEREHREVDPHTPHPRRSGSRLRRPPAAAVVAIAQAVTAVAGLVTVLITYLV